jgi:hypothetical protein
MGNAKGIDRSKQHRWLRLNGTQHRCIYCNIVKKVSYFEGVNTITYQLADTSISTEYIDCTGKPDNSEFY